MSRWDRQPAKGFSVIEMLVVVSILLIIIAISFFNIRGALPAIRADAAMKLVEGQLRTAREVAVSHRHDVQLTFTAPDQIQLTELARPGEPGANLVTLPVVNLGYAGKGAQFTLFAGVPDTPDGFGNTSAINFGGAATQRYFSDGTFVNPAGQPINGTLFVAIPGEPSTVRAVTVLGATGRVRTWKWNGSQWRE